MCNVSICIYIYLFLKFYSIALVHSIISLFSLYNLSNLLFVDILIFFFLIFFISIRLVPVHILIQIVYCIHPNMLESEMLEQFDLVIVI